ncbi:hypothetical protein H8F23_22830 [Pseudomonas sp. P155]|uniref:Uncharacterized protein n=1 Tax=Pseudomonas neuropathica TaxID=2730425 RepID=A0ABS0BUG4_9PSED|nr:hypothetical protein [Pseudomonas neuropathica]MBF6036095.1 hypothetical protein [Pseudomonas neuropathica]
MDFLILNAIEWFDVYGYEVFLWIKTTAALLFFAAIFMSVYLVLFRMEEIFESLGQSEAIKCRGPIKGASFHSKGEILAAVWTVLTFSSLSIRRGDLSQDDFEKFPAGLRVLIKVNFLSFVFAFSYSLIYEFVLEYLSWVDWISATLHYFGLVVNWG